MRKKKRRKKEKKKKKAIREEKEEEVVISRAFGRIYLSGDDVAAKEEKEQTLPCARVRGGRRGGDKSSNLVEREGAGIDALLPSTRLLSSPFSTRREAGPFEPTI